MNKNVSTDIIQDIVRQSGQLLSDTEQGIDWANKFLKKEIAKSTLSDLKEARREIKKIKYAISRNPSAALFGESQVGKSYLVKNLLSRPGDPFTIVNPTTGESHDFLEEINPKGDGVEATSVVTRFSTNVDIQDANYPVMVRLLSPKDIILFLCDTYFSDVTDHDSIPNAKMIEDHIDNLKKIDLAQEKQTYLEEDDVYDIRDYLRTNFRSFTGDLWNSDFWDYCGKVIERVDYRDWGRYFGLLWGDNLHLSRMFELLISGLHSLDFSDEIHVEFTAVLRKHGTLLHVARLREINGEPTFEDCKKENFRREVEYLVYSDKTKRTGKVNKSILCALTAELVFRVEPEMEADKPFLEYSDLLDFPGARSRLEYRESKIEEAHIGNMVLRGKVSYIFNKYSAQNLITNLLFCNRNQKGEVKYIPALLNSWIESYIGKGPDEREEFLESVSHPPLFIIFTFFNEDLKYDSNNDFPDTLDQKWYKRFEGIFELDVMDKDYDWNVNWTRSEPNFKNNYMLRDYKYSTLVYKGWPQGGVETEVQQFPTFPDYIKALRESFVSYGYVQKHFENPEESWDEAAEMNHDGSDLIIRNLSKVSTNLARTQKFVRDLNRLSGKIHTTLRKQFHSDDLDHLIKKADQNGKKIREDMDFVFGKFPYAFGQFVKELVLQEGAVYNQFKEFLNDPELLRKKTINEYILIRRGNPGLSLKKDYQENLDVLKLTYGYTSNEEVEEEFAGRGINLKELFYGEANHLKSSSVVLAEKLRDYWFETQLSLDRYVDLMDKGFRASSLESLFENMKLSFDELNLVDIIAKEIREYVDRYDKVEEAIEMIADISAAIVNKFITSMGAEYYSDAKIDQLQDTDKVNELGLEFRYYESREAYSENEDLAELFDNMDQYDDHISRVTVDQEIVDKFPNIHNIARWRELTRMSFIANCAIPNYDPLANQALGAIIEDVSQHEFKIGA